MNAHKNCMEPPSEARYRNFRVIDGGRDPIGDLARRQATLAWKVSQLDEAQVERLERLLQEMGVS